MSPILLLIVLIATSAVAAVVAAWMRRTRRRQLAALASQWEMHFTPDDAFQLTPRVAAHFPMPGAADVVVRDLVYGQEDGGRLRYLFTVEYTTGVLRTKRRRTAVAMLVENGQHPEDQPFSGIELAPDDLPLAQRYEWLKKERVT